MTNKKPVPLTVVTGFLGAGKTSLLSHILRADHGLRIAVLVNDFGRINIDAELIVNVRGETVSLTNGCLCCTIRDDLVVEVLRLLQASPRPEHIVIECSGVSNPFLVVETFRMTALHDLVELDGVISVVDAENIFRLAADMRPLVRCQIEVADLVVVNKVDLVANEERDEVRRYVEGIAPNARQIDAVHGQVPSVMVLGMAGSAMGRAESKGLEAAVDHVAEFQTWTYESEDPFSFMAVRKAVEDMPAGIYRAKGFVHLESTRSGRAVFQMTGGRAWLRLGAGWEMSDGATQLVLIGKRAAIDGDAIDQHFDHCQAEYDPSIPRASREPAVVKDLRALTIMFS